MEPRCPTPRSDRCGAWDRRPCKLALARAPSHAPRASLARGSVTASSYAFASRLGRRAVIAGVALAQSQTPPRCCYLSRLALLGSRTNCCQRRCSSAMALRRSLHEEMRTNKPAVIECAKLPQALLKLLANVRVRASSIDPTGPWTSRRPPGARVQLPRRLCFVSGLERHRRGQST